MSRRSVSVSGCVLAGVLMAVSVAQAGQGAAPKAPSALKVERASKSEVVLTWTPGDAAPAIVERKLLGAPWPATGATPSATIGTADAARFTDSKVDQFTTYVYRVRTQGSSALSAPSNEVTAGPPPTGFSLVSATPKAMHDHDPAQFASVFSMALDANGDPAFAYLVSDLNNDGENPDSALDFISWNRAAYRWNAPVRVAMVGDVARSGSRPAFSLAFTGASRAGIAYLVADRQVQFAVSNDSGTTWTSNLVQQVPAENAGVASPSLALDGDKVYLAYFAERDVIVASGAAADPPSAWSKQKAPMLPGTGEQRPECISMVVDAEHRPAMSYCLNATEGYTVVVAFWRPGQPSAVKVMDTVGHQTDDPSAKLAVSGQRMAVAFYAARDDAFFNGHHVWMSKSADQGATWGSPSLAADDGGHEMTMPVSVAIDSAGRYAMGAAIGGGTGAAVKCGIPSLMRSPDGSAWTTCAPATRGFPAEGDPRFTLIAVAGNDKVYQAFHTQQPAGGLGAGLVLWREP